MLNLDEPIEFNEAEITYLNELRNPSKRESESWTSYKNDAMMKTIKKNMKERLLSLQGNQCVYCRRMIDVRTKYDGDREHFANKKKYPRFTYEKYNLFLSCITCNRPLKSTFDTIATYNDNYKRCIFTIVHPILDNVDDHIQYIEEAMPEKLTDKGEATIKLFNLADRFIVRENEKELRQREFEALPDTIIELIDATLMYR